MRHPCRVKILLAVASVLALTGLTGCGGDDKPADSPSNFLSATPNAVVKGRMLQVNLAGKDAKPTTGTVILTGKNGAKVTDEADPNGTFEISVYPGEYQVTGTSPQPDGGTAQCAAEDPKTVVTGDAVTTVNVLCFVQ